MSDREEPEPADEDPSNASAKQELLLPGVDAPGDAGSAAPQARLPAPVLIAPGFRAETVDEPSDWRTASGRPRFLRAAAAAAVAVFVGGAFWAISDHSSQADVIARQADQTRALARTVDALDARLSVIESARAHDELVDLRRSVSEIRSNVASSRELSGAIAQLAQRVEKLDRDESAKVDKLNERVDRETSAHAAELAARIDKLEKRAVASAAPVPAPASPPAPPQKQPAAPSKLGPNVSMETTGSISRRRPVLGGYIVLGARDDVALVEGRNGEREVRPGDFLPGAGRVEGIARTGGSWVVLTEQGQILAADEPY